MPFSGRAGQTIRRRRRHPLRRHTSPRRSAAASRSRVAVVPPPKGNSATRTRPRERINASAEGRRAGGVAQQPSPGVYNPAGRTPRPHHSHRRRTSSTEQQFVARVVRVARYRYAYYIPWLRYSYFTPRPAGRAGAKAKPAATAPVNVYLKIRQRPRYAVMNVSTSGRASVGLQRFAFTPFRSRFIHVYNSYSAYKRYIHLVFTCYG